jgi:hypothetical protein
MYESPATICCHARCAALGACYAGFVWGTARRGRPICAARRAELLADTLALENGTRVPVASGPGDPTLSEASIRKPETRF